MKFFSSEVVWKRWSELFQALESDEGSKAFFSSKTETALLSDFTGILLGEFYCGLDVLLKNQDYTEKVRHAIIKDYVSKNSIRKTAARLEFMISEFFPPETTRRKILFAAVSVILYPFKLLFLTLRKIYRFFKPWKETKEQDY